MHADVVWHNGKLTPWADAVVHVTTHALHYGMGVFEGIRCYGRSDGRSAIFRLREHIERLYDSAKICGFEIPYAHEEIERACGAALRGNGLHEAYIRPIAYLGAGPFGVGSREPKVDVSIVAVQWGNSLGDDAPRRGIRCRVSSFARGGVNAVMSKAKICGQYVNSTLAKHEAMASGVDEGIMLDADGQVAEASAENIFVVWRGSVLTPPLCGPILAGITRDTVIQLGARRNVDVIEQPVTRDMLYTADEVFLTGTAAEVMPVREIDGRPVGGGEPGPMTKQIQAAFFEAARGPGTPEPEWLTYVD